MEIVKKNLVSFICLAIALAAVAVAFFVLPTRQSALQTKLDERKRVHDTLNGLLAKQRQLPSVDPDHPDQQVALTQFPNESIIKRGDEIMKAMQAASGSIVEAANKMNKHDLLVPGSLPAPSVGSAIQFRNVYLNNLPPPNLNNQPGAPNVALNAKFARDLKAGMPPNQAEVDLRKQQRADQLKKQMVMFNAGGNAVNQQDVDARIQQDLALLPRQMAIDVADKSKVYIDPTTFEVYGPIAAAAGAPQASDIYWAQLTYWIQSDVVDAINYANRNAKNVKDAPVKHLISYRSGIITQQNSGMAQGMPAFIAIAGQAGGDPDAEVKPNPLASPTGRLSNGLYDVFHFTLVADVEAAHVGDFLRALGYNKFVTPLSCDIKAVDNAVELGHGYMYGETPMLNVVVPCEILYLRRWNEPFIPQQIKALLGITNTQQPGAAPAAQPQANAQP
jgi:hypothetical protein